MKATDVVALMRFFPTVEEKIKSPRGLAFSEALELYEKWRRSTDPQMTVYTLREVAKEVMPDWKGKMGGRGNVKSGLSAVVLAKSICALCDVLVDEGMLTDANIEQVKLISRSLRDPK